MYEELLSAFLRILNFFMMDLQQVFDLDRKGKGIEPQCNLVV